MNITAREPLETLKFKVLSFNVKVMQKAEGLDLEGAEINVEVQTKHEDRLAEKQSDELEFSPRLL